MNDISPELALRMAICSSCLLAIWAAIALSREGKHWTRFGAALAAMVLAAGFVRPQAQPPTIIEVQSSSIDPRPSTVETPASNIDSRTSFVGTSVGMKYHVHGCFYARRIKHAEHFSSQEEAERKGYAPCSECVTPRLAGLR